MRRSSGGGNGKGPVAKGRAGPAVWGRFGLGVALAAAAANVILDPGTAGEKATWWVALLALGTSLVLVVSAISHLTYPEGEEGLSPAMRQTQEPAEKPSPRLGEMLVDHCKLITEEELERALVRQREVGGRLGEVLAEMDLVSERELERVLKVQVGLRDIWRK